MFAYNNWCHAHCKKWILLECDEVHNATYENNYVLNFIVEECIVMFEGTRKYNIKSLGLKLEDKANMKDIYWKVFGTTFIANNEMPTWIVVRQLLSLYFRFYKVTMLESTNAASERRM
jgi:hypothetical protein